MISACSSNTSMRSPSGAKGKPNSACSRLNQPAPSPSSARPPEMWSTVLAALASTDGCRNVAGETIVPSRIRSVRAARPASVVQASSEPSAGPSSSTDR